MFSRVQEVRLGGPRLGILMGCREIDGFAMANGSLIVEILGILGHPSQLLQQRVQLCPVLVVFSKLSVFARQNMLISDVSLPIYLIK